MSIFGSPDLPVPEVSDERIAEALEQIKLEARTRRLVMIAPLALVVAVVGAFLAAPQRHGGLQLVPDADASDTQQLPRVFGANGVWRLAEPINESVANEPSPPSMVEAPAEPTAPAYSLSAPTAEQAQTSSLPVSASTPPTPTPGQSLDELDWSSLVPVVVESASDTAPADTADSAGSNAEPAAATDQDPAPDPSAPAVEATTPPDLSSVPDEDVVVAAQPQPPTVDDAVTAAVVAGDPSEANPSTPPVDPSDPEEPVSTEAPSATEPAGAMATIASRSVLVHRAHVSVTVRVVDDDSSVIDWCNTWVDWGDGSVTGVNGTDEEALCAAECEHEASSSTAGIDAEIEFTHTYQWAIDAAPRIFVATGDGCGHYSIAEFQLNPFTVVPY